MSIQSPVGTLDIKNATLRVGKLEVSNIQGVDTALNVTRANSVLIYDDQASTTTFTGFTSTPGVRDTVSGYLDVADGYVYWGQKLPNAWVMDFEMDIRSGTNAGPLYANVFSTTNTGGDGYSFTFNDSNDKISLYYDGTLLTETTISGLFTASEDWQKVVINYERGLIAISLGGSRKFYYKDIERETPYVNGEYISFSSASSDGRKIRDLRIVNGEKWVYAGESNVVFTQGSVGVGVTDPTTALDVSGTVKATALEGDGSAITNISSANVGDFASNVTRIETLETDLGSNATRVSTLETDLGSNVTRIGTLETGNMTISGQKTFSGDVIFESNVHMQGDVFVANTVNMTVSDPIIELGSNNLNTGDLGIIMTRHGATNSNIAIVFDESADVLRMGYTLGGASDADITLDSNVLAVNVQGALTAASVSGDGSGLSSIQSSNVSDFASNVGRIATLETDLTSNVGRIGTLDTDLTSNVTRITNLESSDMTIGGEKTFSSNLQVGTANLFVDTTTSNVGVGTSTPGYALDVVGDINLSGDFYQGGSIFVSSLWTSGNGSLYYDASNVGIGTNTANYELDVVGNVNATTLLANTAQIHSNLTVGSNVTIDDTASNVISVDGNIKADTFNVGDFVVVAAHGLDHVTNENNSTGDTIISTNGTTGLQTTANVVVGRDALVSGNVGIGTASSAFKLDVHGTANVGTLYSTLTYSNAASNIVTWNSSTNEIIDSGLEKGFTEHPVAAMTDYHTYVEGHGTYEASESNVFSGTTAYGWKIFDYETSTDWATNGGYDSSTGAFTSDVTTTDVGGTRYNGHWVQIKTPYPITLSHSNVYPTNVNRSPVDSVILGSNDDKNWYKLNEFTGQTYSASTWKQLDVNATTPYQYYRMCVTKKAIGDSVLGIREWRLFAEKDVTKFENVHISGDLSSETLQTGYIKWPRKPLKANESEGYVASASSEYPGTTNYLAFRAFDDQTTFGAGTAYAWITGPQTFDATDGTVDSSNAVTFDSLSCHWIQLQSPQAFAVSHFDFDRRESEGYSTIIPQETPKEGYLYASNDGVDWTRIQSFSDLPKLGPHDWHRVDVENSRPYTYYRLVVTKIHPGNAAGYCGVSNLRFFEAATGVGGAPTSAKLQVHGSLGLAKGSSLYAGDSVVAEFPKHDRPLTKYPEVAMTASTVGGYTVSEPTNTFHSNSAFRLHQAFDDSITSNWETFGGSYDTSTRDPQTSGSYVVTTVASGTTYYGVYAQMLAPFGVKVSHVDIRPQNTYGLERLPGIAVFVGSNDGTTWTLIRSVTNNSGALNAYTRYNVNATRAYKYIRIIWNKLTTAGTTTSFRDRAAASEIKIFGTEEGDESVDVVHRSVPNKPGQQQLAVYWDANDSNSYSFADSSNVYDLSGSGVTGVITGTNGFDAEYNAWVFDGSGDYIDATLSNPSQDWVHSTSFWYRQDSVVTATWDYLYHIGTSTNGGAALFALKSDGYLAFANYGLASVRQTFTPTLGKWYHFTIVYSGGGVTTDNVSIYLDGKILLSTYNQGDGSSVSLSANTNIRLGASNSVSAGNATHGSIANFRLFSKALSPDQVRELYEYDAPRFGHRTNVVALHKGNLGVGVTAPTSRFEVAGREDLQEYPPKAMTGYETYMEGHGVFRASQSSPYPSANYTAWKVFDKDLTYGAHFLDSYSSTNDYIYDGAGTRSDGLGGFSGEWVMLEMPYAINLKSFAIAIASLPRAPEDFVILASNDSTAWTQLINYTGLGSSDWPYVGGASGYVLKHFTVPITKEYYRYFAIVVTRTESNDYLQIDAMEYYGTPAPSGLEDGHLTLGKALTAPRFTGHAAGAETPRAESLVVHYDTTVDSVASGTTVVDISGNGINSTMQNGLVYSVSERALVFDGTDDRTYRSSIPNEAGAWVHSVSLWCKSNSGANDSSDTFFFIGEKSTYKSIGLEIQSNENIRYYFWGSDADTPTGSFTRGVWHHVVVTYDGGSSTTSKSVYIDGVKQTVTQAAGTTALNATANDEFLLGCQQGGTKPLNGSISNFKIWGGVALTAEEVAAEYALGRTGKSLNVTDTAVCLGGTVPRAQLDVRGSARFDGKLAIGYFGSADNEALAPLDVRGDYIQSSTYANGTVSTAARFGSSDGTLHVSSIKTSNGAETLALQTTIDNKTMEYNIENGWTYGADSRYALCLQPYNGNVGIGTVSPRFTTEVYNGGLAVFSDGDATWQAGKASATNQGLIIGRTGSNPINGTSSKYWQLNMHSNDNLHVSFAGQYSGYVSKGTQNDQMNANFTGQHRTFIKDVPFTQASDLEGLIVSADQNKYIKMSGGIEAGSNAITMNESLPIVSLSTTSNDKKCFGVVSTAEDPDVRKEQYGIFGSIMRKEVGDTRVYINSVGEGAIWVVNINGPLESGDYITTSNVAGYGMKQDSEFLANYTVAKITMDCDFNPATQPIQRIVKELGNENYWVKTTVSNVTLEEYSNLTDENRTTTIETVYTNEEGEIFTEQDEQSTYTELTRTIYKKIHREESKTEQEGWDLEVRQELVNVLDEHGQLQWEDDPSGATEKAYKIRYLDASGQITDEANAVHTAAFVGVTYHCG